MLQLMREAYKWDGVPQDQMNEALVGDAKKLAEAHLLVERRLKAAAVQQNRRRSNLRNTQKLEAALAVITKRSGLPLQVDEPEFTPQNSLVPESSMRPLRLLLKVSCCGLSR